MRILTFTADVVDGGLQCCCPPPKILTRTRSVFITNTLKSLKTSTTTGRVRHNHSFAPRVLNSDDISAQHICGTCPKAFSSRLFKLAPSLKPKYAGCCIKQTSTVYKSVTHTIFATLKASLTTTLKTTLSATSQKSTPKSIVKTSAKTTKTTATTTTITSRAALVFMKPILEAAGNMSVGVIFADVNQSQLKQAIAAPAGPSFWTMGLQAISKQNTITTTLNVSFTQQPIAIILRSLSYSSGAITFMLKDGERVEPAYSLFNVSEVSYTAVPNGIIQASVIFTPPGNQRRRSSRSEGFISLGVRSFTSNEGQIAFSDLDASFRSPIKDASSETTISEKQHNKLLVFNHFFDRH